MISPVDMVSRLGVGGRLVPFFKCVCVYFVALGEGAGPPAPGAAAVAAKCAPVLCLLLVVALHAAGPLPPDRARYARRVCCGLALSALGDALLVWPQQLLAGMAAFALAHAAYVAAFGLWRGAGAWRAALALYGGAALYVRGAGLAPPGALRLLVPAYAALLATMAWRAVARGRRAGAGGLLFLVSDALLGYTLFGAGGALPYKQVLVMSTYYLGQLGIALSALDVGASA